MTEQQKSADGKGVGSTGWLAAHHIVWDPTGSGRARITHEPTGRALVRQPYMDDNMWKAEKIQFGFDAEKGKLG